jgi:hypothetical protein
MIPTRQPGKHPDADSLSAFAEQLLSGVEREQVLAHMAVCSHCREVVFLAQLGAETEQPAQAELQTGARKSTGSRWSWGWRWAWVPVTALAGFVGIAVVQHVHRTAPDQQMARNLQQAEVMQSAPPATTSNAPAVQQPMRKDEMAGYATALRKEATRQEQSDNAAAAKKEVEAKGALQRSSDETLVSSGVSGGAVHGTLTARAKSSPIGGPIARDQMQQDQVARQMQQNTLQSPSAVTQVANKALEPSDRSQTGGAGAASESVVAKPAQQDAAMAAAPAAPSQMTVVPVTGKNLGLARDEAAKLKAADVKLPNALKASSVAAAGKRIVALDTVGALFLSEDGGKTWTPVKTQWTGRAVLVRTPQSGQSAILSMDQTLGFELVNDQLQTWVSADGKIWKEQPVSGNR